MGHIVMTHRSATNFGGFKVQSGTPEGGDAKALEAAGVFSTVVECVPSGVAKAITRAVNVLILGIGAESYVNCQVQMAQKLLGMYGVFKLKFVKHFAHVRKAMPW